MTMQAAAKTQNPIPAQQQNAHDHKLGLYVHWPFCESKCPYCDFNSHVARRIDHGAWRDALCAALEHMADTAKRRGCILHSIFIGGGTPSLMEPATLAAILQKAREVFIFADDIEITMEANPSSAEAARLEDFAACGVGRLSLGMQSLDDSQLRFLGRGHSAAEALAALAHAQKIFACVSADFIYALPQQSLHDWEQSLAKILGLGLSHLSLYQLTLERGTAFWDAARRSTLRLPDPAGEATRALFDTTRAMCRSRGLIPYETSNFARPGAECRHNLIYWRAHDWLGIGPGAVGRFTDIENAIRVETTCRRDPAAWLDSVLAGNHDAAATITNDSPQGALEEIMLMGLRLAEGVRADRIKNGIDENALTHLMREGLVEQTGGHIRLTGKGAPLIGSIIPRLLAG